MEYNISRDDTLSVVRTLMSENAFRPHLPNTGLPQFYSHKNYEKSADRGIIHKIKSIEDIPLWKLLLAWRNT